MTVVAQDYVEFVDGVSSAKYYSLALVEEAGRWATWFSNGPIGKGGKWAAKIEGASESAARRKYDETINEKRGKGYADRPLPDYLVYGGGAAAPARPAGASAPAITTVQRSASGGMPPVFAGMKALEGGDITVAIAQPAAWAVEEKFDGYRTLAAIGRDGGRVRVELRNVRGEEKGRGDNHPAVVAALHELAAAHPELAAGTVLDAEIVAGTFNDMQHYAGSAGRSAEGQAKVRLVIFDLPFLAGQDLSALPYFERRVRLEALAASFTGPLMLADLLEPSADLLPVIWERGGEGVILKDIHSPYIPGGRYHWHKIKQVATADAVILGYEAGIAGGKHEHTVGSIVVGQYRGGALVPVTRVPGMTEAVRAMLDDSMIGRVIEFSHNGQTADSYRHARFKRFRDDKLPRECTW